MIRSEPLENPIMMKVQDIKLATKAEKANYRYRDFYCFMSLADFTTYISTDDRDSDIRTPISFADTTA